MLAVACWRICGWIEQAPRSQAAVDAEASAQPGASTSPARGTALAQAPSQRSPKVEAVPQQATTRLLASVPELSQAPSDAGFHRSAAPGPSRLRPDHVREAPSEPHADEVATHLTSLVQLLAAAAPRPCWRRSSRAHRCSPRRRRCAADRRRPDDLPHHSFLCQVTREGARGHSFPLELGVALPMDAEGGVHAAYQWCERYVGDPHAALVLVNFRIPWPDPPTHPPVHPPPPHPLSVEVEQA